VVNHPAATWLSPNEDECIGPRTRLLVAASATKKIRHVRFFVDGRPFATITRNVVGLYSTTWSPKGLAVGTHELQAVVQDVGGASGTANVVVKVCAKKK
jgi:hypothetical protein